MIKHYRLPSLITDSSGAPRRAGFEFEFGNLPIVETAEALQKSLGGELDIKSPFEAVLQNSLLGKLKIERDADILKSTRYRSWLESLGVKFSPGTVAHGIETNIDNASRGLIPCEVVTEPIPFQDLDKLDILIDTLNTLGAEGTQESLIYAFGLHINPSIPDFSSTRVSGSTILMETPGRALPAEPSLPMVLPESSPERGILIVATGESSVQPNPSVGERPNVFENKSAVAGCNFSAPAMTSRRLFICVAVHLRVYVFSSVGVAKSIVQQCSEINSPILVASRGLG